MRGLRCCVARGDGDSDIKRTVMLVVPWCISSGALAGANAPSNVKSAGEGWGGGRERERRGIGRGFDQSLWPGDRAFELSCCPGVGIFKFFSCP